MTKKYTTDLNPTQWQIIEPFLQIQRKPKWDLKIVFEGILYSIKNGCTWRDLPANFPPWQTVYYYFKRWERLGVYDLMVSELRRIRRRNVGRQETPSAAIIDSQSVANTAFSTEHIGYDGGKHIKGRKRHLVTDTMGNLLAIKVHAANIHDSKAARMTLVKLLVDKPEFGRLTKIFADKGYRGKLKIWTKKYLKCDLEVVKTYSRLSNNKKIMISPMRWIVERSFAWMGHYRRLSRDFERKRATSESIIKLVFIRISLKHLSKIT